MRCPVCGSTDVAETKSSKNICLDCEFKWVPGCNRPAQKSKVKK